MTDDIWTSNPLNPSPSLPTSSVFLSHHNASLYTPSTKEALISSRRHSNPLIPHTQSLNSSNLTAANPPPNHPTCSPKPHDNPQNHQPPSLTTTLQSQQIPHGLLAVGLHSQARLHRRLRLRQIQPNNPPLRRPLLPPSRRHHRRRIRLPHRPRRATAHETLNLPPRHVHLPPSYPLDRRPARASAGH